MTYTREDFIKDVEKLSDLMDKVQQLEEQKQTNYCYKPYRTLNNY